MQAWIYIYKDLERKERELPFELLKYGYVICLGSLPPKRISTYSWWMRRNCKTEAVGWYKLECSISLDVKAIRDFETLLNKEHAKAIVSRAELASLGLAMVVSESHLFEAEPLEPIELTKPGLLSVGLKVSL